MLFFYPQFIRTFVDLPGHLSLLIHAWNGCNMRCYGCHNYDELIAKKPKGHLTSDQTIRRIEACSDMFDAVIFSGGEFLINEAIAIEDFLRHVRRIFRGKIIIFTNGSFPRKLQRILANNWVDGVHIDLKLPLHCLDPEDNPDLFEAIIGTVPSKRFCQDILDSVEIVIRHNSSLSQVRTVRYPLLSNEYFERIQEYVNELIRKHSSNVPYYINPFQMPS
ncbi:radical SAM protein [Paenibacillus sp. SYP-B3998]|uniref:Radical SAM protein n=2 Tax=Paenibacillus sp. SYP-B3998 TaxID=2678564 RepID=A0A6G3ZUJ8_9BACL|nr:radical SAM protein [Paenibacillus sp. SYP-B3998]